MPESALSDLTVIEYSLGAMGAMCAKALADLGANVIKVEPPEGNASRRIGPFPNGVPNTEASGQFLYLNANKRGITLDLTSRQDYETFVRLLHTADVFVTDLSSQQSKEVGLDYARLETNNSRLIATYVTHFGHSGPYRDYKGSDLVVWHMGGMGYETPLSSVTDLEAERPLRSYGNQAEYLAGWAGAAATMIAVFHRETYGVGQMVDVSAMDTVANHIRGNFASYSYDISSVAENRLKTGFRWIWPCKDGYISLSFVLDHWWKILKEEMGNPQWAEKPEYDMLRDRSRHVDEIEGPLSEWIAQHTRQQLYEMLSPRGMSCFPVNSTREVIASPQFKARGFFVEQDHPIAGKVVQPGPPFRLRRTPWSLNSPAPLLGQHNDEVKSNLQEPAKNEPILSTNSPQHHGPVSSGKKDKPLQGIRVLDFGWILSVPHCGAWLGTMGAEVIRLESQARLELGRQGIRTGADGVGGFNRNAGWNGLNYSKLDLTLNLSKPEAIERVKELVAVSDVVMENFATGVMDKLGLGYDTLREIKPDLVMLSGSTLGVTGPESSASGWGPNVCSYGGQPFITGYEGGPPVNMGGNWPDYLVGSMMAFVILSALRHRNSTGQGQYIEISMAEITASMIPEAFLEYTMNGRLLERMGNHDPNMAPHNVYRCKGHDQWVAISVGNDEEWSALCGAMGHPELSDDSRFACLEDRKRNEQELDRLVEEWTGQLTPSEVADALQKLGVSAGPVMGIMDLMNNRHLNERDFVVEMDHPEVGLRKVAGLPARFGAIPKLAYFSAPLLGQHNQFLLGELIGIDQQRIEKLVNEEVIF